MPGWVGPRFETTRRIRGGRRIGTTMPLPAVSIRTTPSARTPVARRRQRPRQPSVEELLGPLEAACLRALWRHAPATVRDVLVTVNAQQEAELAYTTVMTVLGRLHEKGYVVRRWQGRGYQYEPAYSEVELVEVLGRREVDRLVQRYGKVALAQFVETLQRTNPDLLRRVGGLVKHENADG